MVQVLSSDCDDPRNPSRPGLTPQATDPAFQLLFPHDLSSCPDGADNDGPCPESQTTSVQMSALDLAAGGAASKCQSTG